MRSRRPRGTSLALSVLVLPVVLAAPVLSLPGGDAPDPVPARLHTLAVPSSTGGALALATRAALPAVRTAAFTTLGVTWPDTTRSYESLEVEVRTRTGGAWTPWVDVHGPSDDAPDEGSADTARPGVREGTRPLWVGPSDGVEVRVDAPDGVPSGLRVDLVDPGTSPADGDGRLPLSVAGASEPQPFIVSRAEWGADESLKKCASGYTGTPRVAFVHHTASTNDYTPEQAAAAVRSFYAYHVRSNGWCDIGYNFLVDRFGVVYEGRAGGIERAVLGAHTGGFNANSFGTAMIGTFSTVGVPDALRASLTRLLAWKLGRSYADPTGTATLTAGSGSRFRAGTVREMQVISGHRDAVDTTCPGDLGYAILGQLRQDVRAETGTGFVAPGASPTSTQAGPVVVGAGLLQPLDWRLEVTSVATGEVVRSLTGSGVDRVDTTWDLRDQAGLPVPAGSYRATLFGGLETDPALPWSTTITVQPPPGATAPPTEPTPAPAPAPPAQPDALPSPAASATPSPTATRSASPSPTATRTASPSPTASRSPSPTPVRSTPAPTRSALAPAVPRGASFVPVSPARVLDTRDGTGGRRAPVGAGETLDLVLAGAAGVPADATAVALNLTGTRPSRGTHLTVWPSGAARPETAVLNLRPGATAASLVVAGLGRGGATSVRNLAGTVDLVADVVGYWTPRTGALYHPVTPARLLDTRSSGGRLADQATRSLAVSGAGGVPSSATAVALNVTAVGPARSGFVTVTPGGVEGSTSSVNYGAGETVANRVVTGLSDAGTVDVFAAGSTHVLVDVVGWYGPSSVPGGSTYTPLTPVRLVDSRSGTGTPRGAFGPRTTRDVQATGVAGVPRGATAVVVSLTGTGPTASQTYLAAFPDGSALPGTSDLNLVRAQTGSNLAIVPLSPAGKLSLYNEGGTTHVIADVLGYYAAG